MTTASSIAPTTRKSWYERNYFLLRRLHSLTGIVPIGVFLMVHLLTNSSILWGKFGLRAEGAGETFVSGGVHYFHKEVVWINEQVPHLLLIEITLWVSIAFHSILGVVYALTGKANTARYAYQSNWRYTLQRITGYFGIFFIFYHIATLRWGWTFLVPGGTQWSHNFAASSLAAALQGGTEGMQTRGLIVSLFYLLGITALVFHFANGLWTAAITWGLTVSQQAQKRWGYVCLALGASLMAMAWGSLFGFAFLNVEKAREVELRHAPAAAKSEAQPKAAAGDLPKSDTR